MSQASTGVATGEFSPKLGYAATLLVACVWMTPFIWMLVAAFNPQSIGAGMASLIPSYIPTLANFREAWASADFPRYGLNTAIISLGILAVQIVTITLAGYAFARLEFPGRTVCFYLFLLQLMLAPVVLIVPNLTTIAKLSLYDSLLGVMAPYFASAFGTFLMRQAFRAIPRELEDAALIDGASVFQRIGFIYLPLAKPSLVAFSIVSVTAHWNEFLWPLAVLTKTESYTLQIGLNAFQGELQTQWHYLLAMTVVTLLPVALVFVFLQRFITTGIANTGMK